MIEMSDGTTALTAVRIGQTTITIERRKQ